MAGTTSPNATGRVRFIDPNLQYSRWSDTLISRKSPLPPDGVPAFIANPEGGFHDITTALTNLAFLVRKFTKKRADVAAGAGTAAQVIWAGPGGELMNITVQTTNTAAISFYDNASAASGSVIFTVPANAPTNTFYQIQTGVVNGITAGKVLNSPALSVSYTEV